MTTTPQTEAQRLAAASTQLAETLDYYDGSGGSAPGEAAGLLRDNAAELRRLDAREDELLHHVCVLQGMNNESLESIKVLTDENDQLRAQVERLQGGEPDMRHPKVQAILGAKARLECELALVENIVDAEDPDDCTGGLVEYWGKLHDKVQTLKRAQPAAPALVPLSVERIAEIWKQIPGDADIVELVRAVERDHGIGPVGGEGCSE